MSIAAYAMRSNIEDSVHNNMYHAMKYYNVDYNAFTWNSTQYNVSMHLKFIMIMLQMYELLPASMLRNLQLRGVVIIR